MCRFDPEKMYWNKRTLTRSRLQWDQTQATMLKITLYIQCVDFLVLKATKLFCMWVILRQLVNWLRLLWFTLVYMEFVPRRGVIINGRCNWYQISYTKIHDLWCGHGHVQFLNHGSPWGPSFEYSTSSNTRFLMSVNWGLQRFARLKGWEGYKLCT